MTYIVHVNRSLIAANAKDGGNRPPFIVRQKGKPVRYASRVEILGPSRFVTGGQLPCGAKAWLETESDIELHGECSFQEAKDKK